MEENPMFTKPKSWLSGGLWRPKNPHSLEHLKYLHGVLGKNQTVTEHNRALLVETLRSISEILIWGDQNDSSVFDFFLEKNMLAFFLRFMKQKYGRFICVQLLQTLNILFENISNETSVYYLLSNNHINSIIVHKFDFSDEEVMAYYISFLKTLSLKLNKHTIHFFYNEHTNDFALYTEAIKFFNHSESMVRIAVRTITLNVYKVDDKGMLRYIRDKTAAPYFSNLVWFIGNHVLELDACVRHDIDHNSRDRLADLVAEHLDHLHYLNDILCLEIDALNEVLTDHLLNRLLIPLYVYSLTKRAGPAGTSRVPAAGERPHVTSTVSLFLLSQVFLIMHHAPLVRQLANIIFHGDKSVCRFDDAETESPQPGRKSLRGFLKPAESLAKSLDNVRDETTSKPQRRRPAYSDEQQPEGVVSSEETVMAEEAEGDQAEDGIAEAKEALPSDESLQAESVEVSTATSAAETLVSGLQNSTDDEKLMGATSSTSTEFSLENRPYLEAVFSGLSCPDTDYDALFALCLLYAVGHNTGINQEVLDSVSMPTDQSRTKYHYNTALVEKLITVISLSCQSSSKIRLATLELTIKLLKTLVYKAEDTAASTSTGVVSGGAGECFLQDRHLAAIEGAREEATLLLRNFYKVWEKSEEIFLDMFEDEFREMQARPLNVEYLTMDASILLPPTGTPLTGIHFNKRLPCGEVERARRAIRVFFSLRGLSLVLRGEPDTQLPLTRQEECVKLGDVLDLNNSDLIACTVITKDNKRERRFLVIDVLQLILVEPDSRRLGWGKVRFVGFLQDVEVTGDKEDSRSLHITIHKPSMNAHAKPLPLLSARFQFDDHIRCMAAKQRLSKGRLKARQRKMQMIARLLELPASIVESMYQPPQGFTTSAVSLRAARGARPSASSTHPGRAQSEVLQRSVFASVDQTGVFDSAARREHDARSPSNEHLPRPRAPAPRTPGGATAISRGTGGGVIKTPSATVSAQQQARLKKKAERAARARQQQQAALSGPIASKSAECASREADSLDDSGESVVSSASEAHVAHVAFRSLNPGDPGELRVASDPAASAARQSRNNSNSAGAPPSSSASGSSVEIPLEDMSQRAKNLVLASRELFPAHRLRAEAEGARARSVSSSPKRGRRHSSESSSRQQRGDSSSSSRNSSPQSVSSTASKGSSSSSDARRMARAGSCPSPRRVNSNSRSSSPSIDVTSFIGRKRASTSRVVISKEVANVGAGPKTLTPASEPVLSLVCDTDAAATGSGMDSPKLMPPATEETISSLRLEDASQPDQAEEENDVDQSKIEAQEQPDESQSMPILVHEEPNESKSQSEEPAAKPNNESEATDQPEAAALHSENQSEAASHIGTDQSEAAPRMEQSMEISVSSRGSEPMDISVDSLSLSSRHSTLERGASMGRSPLASFSAKAAPSVEQASVSPSSIEQAGCVEAGEASQSLSRLARTVQQTFVVDPDGIELTSPKSPTDDDDDNAETEGFSG